MKKIFLSIIAAAMLGGMTSCSDMLSTESTRQATPDELNQKTDSMFYALGIMQAMQQLADQHFFQNELRGELVSTTSSATTHLQNLSNYSAGTENKYDSVYLYYKVINNCNYYLAHRDTTLATSSKNVTKNEFAAVAAFRAWTYLQLTHQYGDVPYITEPMLTISQINNNTSTSDYKNILRSQAEYMESLKAKFTEDELEQPNNSRAHSASGTYSIGQTNWGTTKSILLRQCYLPFNVVLGDLYLEMGEYEKAAKCYFQYLRKTAEPSTAYVGVNNMENYTALSSVMSLYDKMPADFYADDNNKLYENTSKFNKIFSGYSDEVISQIPMAVNYQQGTVTSVPDAFGYDYYATSKNRITSDNINECPQKEDIQVVPSQDYYTLARDSAVYYYYSSDINTEISKTQRVVKPTRNFADTRMSILRSITKNSVSTGTSKELVYVSKPSTGNIILYRNTTVYMHLAEALNRMGHPDLAFAILRDGIHNGIKKYCDTLYQEGVTKYSKKQYYLTQSSLEMLTNGDIIPFLNSTNVSTFTNDNTNRYFVGVHAHGAGNIAGDLNMISESPYNFEDIVVARAKRNRTDYGQALTGEPSQEEIINAMEDLLAEEYALEFAFEGTRFSDIIRIARHKNMQSCYGTGFGDTWMAKMLSSKGKTINTTNCYLPFK